MSVNFRMNAYRNSDAPAKRELVKVRCLNIRAGNGRRVSNLHPKNEKTYDLISDRKHDMGQEEISGSWVFFGVRQTV